MHSRPSWLTEESVQFSSVQLLSHVQLFATPWTAACQASLSVTNSRSLLKLMSIKSGMPSNHLILCHPLLLLPSVFLSIRVFSNKSVLHIRWPEYWSFSFSISPSNEYSELISFKMDWLDPLNRGLGDYLCIVLIFHNQGILFLKIKLSLQTLYNSLLDPWTVAHQSSLHGILQARILEWVAMPSSRGSSWPRDRTHVSYVSCIGDIKRRLFTTGTTWEALIVNSMVFFFFCCHETCGKNQQQSPVQSRVAVSVIVKPLLHKTESSNTNLNPKWKSFVACGILKIMGFNFLPWITNASSIHLPPFPILFVFFGFFFLLISPLPSLHFCFLVCFFF